MDKDKKKGGVSRRTILKRAAIGGIGAAALGAGLSATKTPKADAAGISGELAKVMKERNLTPDNVLAAAKTYIPEGVHDPYICLSSGGQSGHLFLYGVPSMRLIKTIAVFAPETWQGWGYDKESQEIIKQGSVLGRPVHTGDTHHPGFSETKGDYDGEYAFINDKSQGRIAVIDTRDWQTKQIVKNPVLKSTHGGTSVTQNTEYIFTACQYAAPYDNKYHDPMDQEVYNTIFRGGHTYWKFDRKKGRVDMENSFTIELPPYMQDINDCGKLMSGDWGFSNSFNTERYTGGIERGMPPFEAGCSANDTDFIHMTNWKKAEEVIKKGNYKTINGHKVIPIKVAVENGLVYLIPVMKSPHGITVSPDGRYILASGKLDTHTSVYDFKKIQHLIENKIYDGRDPYGLPILSMRRTLHGMVQTGLGPLHNQFDVADTHIAYNSLFVDSAIVKYDYLKLKVLDRIPIHYNVGHLTAVHGDTVNPRGKYLISLNKLAIDRFADVGPLHPQNHELIDISDPLNKKMRMLYAMPFPLGEPHYAQIIETKTVEKRAWKVYPLGTDPVTMARSPNRTLAGREKIVRKGNHVEVWGTAIRSHFNPEHIYCKVGDKVTIHITNLERAEDETHDFGVYYFNVTASLEPGKTATVEFVADKEGIYPFYCQEFCSALHLEMFGYIAVLPKDGKFPEGAFFNKEG